MGKIGGVSAWTLSVCQPTSNLSRGSVLQKINPSKEWIIFLGVDKMVSVHQKYPE